LFGVWHGNFKVAASRIDGGYHITGYHGLSPILANSIFAVDARPLMADIFFRA
jgi:hypothetical protein